MAEKVLSYDRAVVPQEYGWSCGPAATQVVLNSLGIYTTENALIQQIGTHTGGTDDISWIETRALDSRVPRAGYARDYIPNDPPTKEQKDKLWKRVKASIDAGFGVVMNWVAPPNNYPRGVRGSVSPTYNGGTIYHYVAAMGYYEGPEGNAYWIADSGFRPFGYWVSADQAATLISPKGYAYATAVADVPQLPTVPKPSGRDGYAKAIIAEGRKARVGEGRYDHPVITDKGITIALATALVESNLTMYANASDPESLKFPHDAVGSDHDSSGLFQQRPPWWGTIADRMDPAKSASLFYHALSGLDYNSDKRTPGWYAQSVQQSAFPDRYDERWPDAQALFAKLAPSVPVSPEPVVPVVPDKPGDPNLFPSRSPYRDNNDRFMTTTDILLNLDAMSHAGLLVEPAAIRGEPWAIEKIVRLAAGQGPGATLWWDSSQPDSWAIGKAQYILKYIEQTNPDALSRYISTKGPQP